MATVSVRVPDELKERMDDHPEINWSAVIRQHIVDELETQANRDLAKAVLASERVSQSVSREAVADLDTSTVIREWRDRRYGKESTSNES